MNHALAAQIGLTVFCVTQAATTIAIDCSRTHATNPRWPGHARFHVVWQSATVVLLSALEVSLVWLRVPYRQEGFYLAVILAGLSPVGFMTAFFSRRLFAGTLSDPNGIPPLRLHIAGAIRCFDMNLIAVLAGLITLSLLTVLYRA